MFSTLLIVINLWIWFLKSSSAYHILVSGICGSGHWAIPITVSKKLLNDGHFITFVISEACPQHLNDITTDAKYKYKYQILYGNDSCHVFHAVNEQMSVFDLSLVFYEASKCLFNPIYYFLSVTNMHRLDTSKHHSFYQILLQNYKHQNEQNNHIFKNISFNNTNPVDLILSDTFLFWGVSLSKVYDIPCMVRTHAANAAIDFEFKDGPHQVLHKDITLIHATYLDKVKSFVCYMMTYLGLYMVQRPINDHLARYGLDANYKVMAEFNKGTTFYMPLGYPFLSSFHATQPRLKQFGFIVSDEVVIRNEYASLIEWLELKPYDTMNVLLISMGSNVAMDDVHVASIFEVFSQSNLLEKHGWRVLWALRRANIDNIKDNALKHRVLDWKQNHYLRIVDWIPQLYLLRTYDNIAMFMTHCGSNGIHEALYAKTIILSFPHNADQFWYAKRIEELECGVSLDRDIKDSVLFTTHFVNQLTHLMEHMDYYQSNVRYVHNMINDFHGSNGDEVVVWIKNIIKYGTKPLVNHNIYDEKDKLQWYQDTDIDLYAICMIFIGIILYVPYRCIVYCCCGRIKVEKMKIE
eukprot:433249_1